MDMCSALHFTWLNLLRVISLRVIACNYLYCDELLGANHVDSVSGWDYTKQCPLHAYQSEDVVECLDSMARDNHRRFYISFVGDSRTRQQFISFLKKVPLHDAEMEDFHPDQWKIQHDVDIVSPMLNVRVSFKWRPVLNDNVIDEFDSWIQSPVEVTPSVILLGMGVHHMLPEHGANHTLFEDRLRRLAPVLDKLSTKSRIIWFHQNPVLLMFESSATGHFSNFITPNLVDRYNSIAGRTFQGTKVLIWNSSEPLSEEYVRSCPLIGRHQKDKHHDCEDFVHMGFVAIHRSTHLFFNFLCNRVLVIHGQFVKRSTLQGWRLERIKGTHLSLAPLKKNGADAMPKWHSLLKEPLIQEFKIIDDVPAEIPTIIDFGMAANHSTAILIMTTSVFPEQLEQWILIIQKLPAKYRIIWSHQNPFHEEIY